MTKIKLMPILWSQKTDSI